VSSAQYQRVLWKSGHVCTVFKKDVYIVIQKYWCENFKIQILHLHVIINNLLNRNFYIAQLMYKGQTKITYVIHKGRFWGIRILAHSAQKRVYVSCDKIIKSRSHECYTKAVTTCECIMRKIRIPQFVPVWTKIVVSPNTRF
jgi:hypothetical protein